MAIPLLLACHCCQHMVHAYDDPHASFQPSSLEEGGSEAMASMGDDCENLLAEAWVRPTALPTCQPVAHWGMWGCRRRLGTASLVCLVKGPAAE